MNTHKLEELEARREALYEKLRGLGDFRRGTIAVNFRKCGKRNCACAKAGHPGHGPQYLWNTTIKGKSYAKNLKLGPELHKYMIETDTYRAFRQLCKEIVEINEKICELRPAVKSENEDEATTLKKKLQVHFKKKYEKK